MKVQTRLFRATIEVMNAAAMDSVADNITVQVNAFLSTLDMDNVLDVQTSVTPAGKYDTFTHYQTIVTYLE